MEIMKSQSNTDSQNPIQFTINDIGGEIVKDNETYLLKDNKTLDKLVLSSTLLNPFKQTNIYILFVYLTVKEIINAYLPLHGF